MYVQELLKHEELYEMETLFQFYRSGLGRMLVKLKCYDNFNKRLKKTCLNFFVNDDLNVKHRCLRFYITHTPYRHLQLGL